jgi:adenylate cyclase
VRKSGNRVRITAQLIDAETDAHIWAEQYDRLLENVFALQDDITMCVVGAIEPSLRKAEVDRVKRQRPNTFDAYDLLLRSQQFVFAGMPKEAAKAIPLLEEALKIEPDYSAAHAYLSWCLHSRYGRGGLREDDRVAAVQHARTAITLGNDDATALAIAALVLAYDGNETAFTGLRSMRNSNRQSLDPLPRAGAKQGCRSDRNVCLWHKADITIVPSHVRFRG